MDAIDKVWLEFLKGQKHIMPYGAYESLVKSTLDEAKIRETTQPVEKYPLLPASDPLHAGLPVDVPPVLVPWNITTDTLDEYISPNVKDIQVFGIPFSGLSKRSDKRYSTVHRGGCVAEFTLGRPLYDNETISMDFASAAEKLCDIFGEPVDEKTIESWYTKPVHTERFWNNGYYTISHSMRLDRGDMPGHWVQIHRKTIKEIEREQGS